MQPTSQKPQTTAKKKPGRRAPRRRQPLPTAAIFVIVVLIALAGLVGLSIYNTLNDQAEANQPIDGVESYSGQEQTHVQTPVTYAQIPPVGGPHSSAWQNCGVYLTPIANENGVHSLEHGAVWITYLPDLPITELQKLQALTRQSGYRLLSPYPDLPSPIVASAWGYQLKFEQADDSRLISFIKKYEQSPLGPEPGAPCTGGLGQPG